MLPGVWAASSSQTREAVTGLFHDRLKAALKCLFHYFPMPVLQGLKAKKEIRLLVFFLLHKADRQGGHRFWNRCALCRRCVRSAIPIINKRVDIDKVPGLRKNNFRVILVSNSKIFRNLVVQKQQISRAVSV